MQVNIILITVFTLLSFFIILVEHVASRHYTFREKIGTPWDLGIGLVSLGIVYSGLLAVWWMMGLEPGVKITLWAFWSVTGAGWGAVAIAYAIEKVVAAWRRPQEENLRLKRRMDRLARGERDGHRYGQPGQTPIDAAGRFLEDLGEDRPKPN